ncbi:MAG: lysophospholipid acyltransferase family protein [Chloroflexota bacterium]|nr:lysophospholipid acyltransferase family protein [Chloroflexota bacterium]
MRDKIELLLYAWFFGLIGGLVIGMLRITGRLIVLGYQREKLDPKGKGLIVFANHPSPAEPIIVEFLFFPWFLFSPRFVPFALPACEYYRKWWFAPFRRIAISIDRDSLRGMLNSTVKVEKAMEEGRIVVIHPEEERNYVGGDDSIRYSSTGKRMMSFRRGTRRIFLYSDCVVLPIWIEGGQGVIPNKADLGKWQFFQWPRVWNKITVKIGDPLDLSGFSKDNVLEYLENVLLELADREIP